MRGRIEEADGESTHIGTSTVSTYSDPREFPESDPHMRSIKGQVRSLPCQALVREDLLNPEVT